MLSIRRWCARHGFQLAIAGAILGGAWLLHQTQSALIWEVYQVLSRPFQGESPVNVQARLTDARILELEQRLVELERQNQQLKQLIGGFDAHQQSSVPAPIIGRSSDAWWRQVILGRGSQAGIKEGFIVTGIGGLVGRVMAVTPESSRVLLVSDPSSRVGAMISRSRSMGLIEGNGSKLVTMRFFEKDPDVRPGDPVATSSVSRLFPSGIPIGRVQSVQLNRGPAPEVKIHLTAPINHLEWVLVHPFESK
jgi:rod shape-determining protein MreC